MIVAVLDISGSLSLKINHFSDLPSAGFHSRGIWIIKVKHTSLANSVSALRTIGLNPLPNWASRAAVTAGAIPKVCLRTFGSQLQSNRFYLTWCLVKRRKHPLKVRCQYLIQQEQNKKVGAQVSCTQRGPNATLKSGFIYFCIYFIFYIFFLFTFFFQVYAQAPQAHNAIRE